MKKLGSLLIVSALVVAACSGAVQEELVERAAEPGGVGDVEIDVTDDTVSISAETEEGSFAVGSGLDVPDGLTFPLPDGGEVATAFADETYVVAAVQYPKDRYEEIVAFYKDWTSADDREWNFSESSIEMSGETIRGAQWISGASAILVNECAALSGQFDSVCVALSQSR